MTKLEETLNQLTPEQMQMRAEVIEEQLDVMLTQYKAMENDDCNHGVLLDRIIDGGEMYFKLTGKPYSIIKGGI